MPSSRVSPHFFANVIQYAHFSLSYQALSQFMHDPKQSHLVTALHVVRYLKGRPGLGILLSSDMDDTLKVFCDFNWASCAVTRKSVTGYCIKLGQSLISWKSKNKKPSPEAQQKLNIGVWLLLWQRLYGW